MGAVDDRYAGGSREELDTSRKQEVGSRKQEAGKERNVQILRPAISRASVIHWCLLPASYFLIHFVQINTIAHVPPSAWYLGGAEAPRG